MYFLQLCNNLATDGCPSVHTHMHIHDRYKSHAHTHTHAHAHVHSSPCRYTLHRSLPNTSTTHRRAFVGHYMSAASLLPWDCAGLVPPTTDHRDVFMVAGKDPYAWKGYVDEVTFAFVRPDVGQVEGDVAGRGALAALRASGGGGGGA